MRVSEIIRGVLDLIDRAECGTVPQTPPPVQLSIAVPMPQPAEIVSFSQVLADVEKEKEKPMYDNSAEPHIHGVHAVTTDAGLGGTNGPKHPSDLRVQHPSMYPGHQSLGE